MIPNDPVLRTQMIMRMLDVCSDNKDKFTE